MGENLLMLKKIILMICLTSFLFITKVKANTINEIEMYVFINNNGDAEINEVWNASVNDSTEVYRTFSLVDKTITNFSVSDDTGIKYIEKSKWNINATFDEKKYSYGIIKDNNTINLCWGISKYGNRKYTLKYTINDFVTQYSDTQGIYYNFLKLDHLVNHAKVIISSDIKYSLSNSRIWAFGNKGKINFSDGKIIMDSISALDSSQYMTGLIRFHENYYNVKKTSSKSFDNVYDSAMSSVNDNKNINDNSEEINASPIEIIISCIVVLFIIPIIFIKILKRTIKKAQLKYQMNKK